MTAKDVYVSTRAAIVHEVVIAVGNDIHISRHVISSIYVSMNIYVIIAVSR